MHDGRIAFDAVGGATSHRLLGKSTRRRYLTIFAPSAGTATITNESPAVAGSGITLTAGMAPLYFDDVFHGDCIHEEWYVIYTNSGANVSWIETMCNGEPHEAQDAARATGQRASAKRGY